MSDRPRRAERIDYARLHYDGVREPLALQPPRVPTNSNIEPISPGVASHNSIEPQFSPENTTHVSRVESLAEDHNENEGSLEGTLD